MRNVIVTVVPTVCAVILLSTPLSRAQAMQPGAKKPNFLVIFGDDVGFWNTSAYNRGMMGYRTPNIDRIAKEGAISPIITRSSPVPQGARRSSPDNRASAPAC
jgi:hypothetical protein